MSYVETPDHLAPYLGCTVGQMHFYADSLERGELVERYTRQRRGKSRTITFTANEGLRNIHRRVLSILTCVTPDLPDHVNGFVRGRSVLSNAYPHCGKRFLKQFDLADFFDSVRQSSVADGLAHYGFQPAVCRMIARLTTVDGALPTGFGTSPAIANIALFQFDRDLQDLAARNGLSLARYADDISMSSDLDFDIVDELRSICHSHHLVLNESKTRSVKYGQPMFVTGLSTSDSIQPRLPRRYKSRIRQELFFIERHGLEDHTAQVGGSVESVFLRLAGQLAYVRSIEPQLIEKWKMNYPKATNLLARERSAQSVRKRDGSLLRLANRVRNCDPLSTTRYTPIHTVADPRG